jgi:hypothetical protein
MERMRVSLRIVQEREGWNDTFVVNPMHVAVGQGGTPKHLLIVGQFVDQDLEPKGMRMHRAITKLGYSPHLHLYDQLEQS